MSSENSTIDTDGKRRRLSKKAVIAICVVAALTLAGGTAFAVKAANQAKINAACQEASDSYELAAQDYVTAEQELSSAVTAARDETSRGYADTEEGTALLVQADQRLALGMIATEAPDCHSHQAAEQITSQANDLEADAVAISTLTADIAKAVDEHVINAATADYAKAITAYNESKAAGEASYEAANTAEGFAGSAENNGKLEALRAALDAAVTTDAVATTREEVEALDNATAEVNTAKTTIDEAKTAVDTAKTAYDARIAVEKAAAEKAAAEKAAADRKAEQARKNQSNSSGSSSKKSSGSSNNNKSSNNNNSNNNSSGSGSNNGSGDRVPRSTSVIGPTTSNYTCTEGTIFITYVGDQTFTNVCQGGKWVPKN